MSDFNNSDTDLTFETAFINTPNKNLSLIKIP